jgi:hypothetical protein
MRRFALAIVGACLALSATAADAARPRPHPGPGPDTELRKAQTLISQGYRHIAVARKRTPKAFGGHEARAQRLLKQATLELNEAATYREYNRKTRPARTARS